MGFFDESEEEISENIRELTEEQQNIKDRLALASSRFKGKGFLSFMKSLFEESEEELRESLEENEEALDEYKKKLADYQVREEMREKRRRKRIVLKTSGFMWRGIIAVFGGIFKLKYLITLLLLLIILIITINGMKSDLKHQFCMEDPECDGCNSTIYCFDMVDGATPNGESLIYFKIRNLNTADGECMARFTSQNDTSRVVQNIDIGNLKSGKAKAVKKNVVQAKGESYFSLEPFCTY